jgi:hypothetical protein
MGLHCFAVLGGSGRERRAVAELLQARVRQKRQLRMLEAAATRRKQADSAARLLQSSEFHDRTKVLAWRGSGPSGKKVLSSSIDGRTGSVKLMDEDAAEGVGRKIKAQALGPARERMDF